MKRLTSFRCNLTVLSPLVLLVPSAAAGQTPPAAVERLNLGGFGGANEALRITGKRFTSLNKDTEVDLVAGLGTNGAINAAIEGVIQVAMSGRPLTAAQMEHGLTVVSVVCTPYVYATSHPGPVTMDRSAIPAAFADPTYKWPDGLPLRVILRPLLSSDELAIIPKIPGLIQSIQLARQRVSVPVATTDQENADLAEHIPGSLAGTTWTQIMSERRPLRLVAIDGVAPSIAAFESGQYPFGRILYVVAGQKPTPVTVRFLNFLRSPDGVTALREAGIVACPKGPNEAAETETGDRS